MIYSVIEKDEPHASTGRLIGVRQTSTEAIRLAEKTHRQHGKPIFVASRTNLTKPIFELGASRADKTKKQILDELRIILESGSPRARMRRKKSER